MREMVKFVLVYQNSDEILNKLNSKCFLSSSLSTDDFSTIHKTLHHSKIKVKLTELIGKS